MILRTIDRWIYVLATILILYIIIFSGISIWRYNHYLVERSGDLLLFEQVVYNTAHGKPFYNNFSMQNHFGDHNSPILAILAPFTLIMPVPYVLYIFTALSISISAIPIYLISIDNLRSKAIAMLLVVCYLMLPTFICQAYQSFHEINLVVPFLTVSFYYFSKYRFYPFIITFIIGLLVKEDVSLTLLMFAPYAVIRKRDAQWYIIPAILSVFWFLLSIKIVIPLFSKSNSYGVGLGYFTSFGSSISEVIVNILGKPLNTFAVLLNQNNLLYLFFILLPVGLALPFISAEFLFAVPSILLNLLSDSDRFRLAGFSVGLNKYYFPKHMSLMASTFLFIALIYSIKNLGSLSSAYSKKITVVLVLCITVLVAYNDRFMLVRYLYYDSDINNNNMPSVESINRVLLQIPSDVTVASNRSISTHLYDKKEAYDNVNKDADYLILTAGDISSISDSKRIANDYSRIYSEKNIHLFKRNKN